jgi:DNA-binding IclR family transcriptional regulator
MMLRDLAKAAACPRPRRTATWSVFVRTGLVSQDGPSGRYDLGHFALDLGLASLARLDPVRAATPVLDALAEETRRNRGAGRVGQHGPDHRALGRVAAPGHVNLRTGAVMPLLHSAIGQLDEELHISARAEDRITRSDLDELVAEARAHGMSRTVGGVIPGINAFAAPVFDHEGKMALALAGLGPAGLVPPHWNGALPKAIRAAALAVSRELGWRGSPANKP